MKDKTQEIKAMIQYYSDHLLIDCKISDYRNYELQMICYFDCISDLYEIHSFYKLDEVSIYFHSILCDTKSKLS